MADLIEPDELEGAKLLVGITRFAEDGSYEQEQYAGTASIEDCGSYCLVHLHCSDGEVRNYPFDARSLDRAAPGEYRLRNTGEVVTNPDFLMTWSITKGDD